MRFYCLVLSALPFLTNGQVIIKGTVRDSETRLPIVGVHVITSGASTYGSTTNLDGGFSVTHTGRLDSIRISCIGYTTQVIKKGLPPVAPLTIQLVPYVVPLQALTVKPPSPEQLIRDAVRAISKNYSTTPFQVRGFYREIIRADTVYFSVAEAIFESQLTAPIDDEPARLKLVQGRRSETVTGTRMFEDYHPGGGPNYLVSHLLEAGVPAFLQEKNFKDYNYSIDSITTFEGKDVYLITFDQRDNLKENLWKGNIFMEAESLAIIDLAYSLSDKGIAYRKHLTGTDKTMASLLGIDFTVLSRTIHYSYRRNGNTWSLHHASLMSNIDFKQPRKDIDQRFLFHAEMLALRQQSGPIEPFPKNELWRKNQLVKNLPGDFDEGFWGSDNFIQPQAALTKAVERMDILRSASLPSGLPEGWELLHAGQAKVYKKDSAFLLKPYVESRWKDEEQGPFLWQPAIGNFELYTRLRVTKAQDTLAAADAGFQIGGLMVRAKGESENHVMFALGCMGNSNLKVVSQNTINGKSATYVTRAPGNVLEIRLRRNGARLTLEYVSPETKKWTLLREFERKGWPAELQLGIMGYAHLPGNAPNRKPDLLVRADGFRITTLKP